MEERRGHKLKSVIFRGLVIMNTLMLFQANVGQVSAEEFANDFDEQPQVEEVSEVLNESSEEFLEDEERPNSEEEVTSHKESDLEVSSDETDAEDVLEEVASDELDEVELEDSEELDGIDLEDSVEVETGETVNTESSEETEAFEETEEVQEVDEVEESEEIDEANLEAMTASAQRNTSKKNVEVDRISGQNRYKNAAELSASGWNTATTVILTNGETFTDSLTGSPLASIHNAPILLTRADRLPSETLAEIKRLKPTEIIALGGELSISNSVLNTLQANGFSTRRIGGRNRYILAENIAKEVMAVEGTKHDAFLVSGEVYSDAMSIAPVAASKRLPIFLTRNNVLHETVINAIPHVNQWTIIGGNLTINYKVQEEMNNKGAKTRRIEGRSRYDVNRNVINQYGASGDHMYVASGEHYTDATPASVLAARKNSSVLLVRNNKATLKEQRDFANKKGINKLTFIGGALTLSKASEDYFNNQNHLIYLDPGHGGRESGTVGWVDGKKHIEKDLNLQVSLKVRDLLEDKGYGVFMSRTDDTYVSLQRRPEQANNLGADIFVSLHHNAMPNSSTTTGIETYYYKSSNSYPPLDKNRPYHNDPERLSGSKRLSELIHGELIDHTGAYDRGVKRAAFVVVREAHMPAVLLEYGFMSTPADLRVFTQNWYQNRLAQATVDGIERYFAI